MLHDMYLHDMTIIVQHVCVAQIRKMLHMTLPVLTVRKHLQTHEVRAIMYLASLITCKGSSVEYGGV